MNRLIKADYIESDGIIDKYVYEAKTIKEAEDNIIKIAKLGCGYFTLYKCLKSLDYKINLKKGAGSYMVVKYEGEDEYDHYSGSEELVDGDKLKIEYMHRKPPKITNKYNDMNDRLDYIRENYNMNYVFV